MPLPLAWLVAFALGAVFARAAEGELARAEGPVATSRPIAVVAGFAAFVLVPVVGYFAAFHGDWAYLYLVDWQAVPSAIDLVLVVGAGALVLAGFASAVPFLRAKRKGAVDAMIAVPVGIAALLALAFARRLLVSASHAQYVGAMGVESIGASALGKGVLLGLVAIALGAAWTVRSLRTTSA
jgi:hypothetical protein